MKQDCCILIHYHEIALKGKNRSWFERQLIHNIKHQLSGLPYNKVHLTAARIFCFGVNKSLWTGYASRLKKVMGIKHAILMDQVASDIDIIQTVAANQLEGLEFSSFRISARRQYKEFHLSSQEINQIVGQYIQSIYLKPVKLKEADINVVIELVKGIERCRISSIEPNLLSDEIINFIAQSDKILPHFHIPLQSGSDNILKRMRRRYDTQLYALKINKIKKLIPNCCIGVDVIVGFPSESDKDFLSTYDFLNKLDITYLHVFSYSERENTKAIFLDDKISENIKQERRKLLVSLSDYKKKYFIENNLSKNHNVLFESYEDGYINGFTENYIKVSVKGNRELINTIHKVKLVEYYDNLVFGEIIH